MMAATLVVASGVALAVNKMVNLVEGAF
jgi:hypothetical protein